MGILLIIFLVMIISIGAISAADTNDTLLGDVSNTNIETLSSSFEQEGNVTSLYGSENCNDVLEISANDNQNEISNQKVVGDTSFNLNKDVLSASNDDLLGANPNFYYAGKWYGDLDDAVDDACDNNGGTIYITARAWGYDSAEREITISDGVSITFQPYNSGDLVIFDGQGNKYWFFKIDDKNAHITFNDITFRNGGDGSLASDGGAIRIIHGAATFNNCVFDNNEAGMNSLHGFGWGGAIFLDESDASLIARNCRFTNNKADNGGGAVCVEDGASASFENCYFSGNTAPNENHVLDKDDGSHTFANCRFIGSGSLDIEVEATTKTVHITPDVSDNVNYAVLYKNGAEYDRTACNNHDTATFSNLDKGTYTVYMMKNWEAKYEYPGNTFSLINPSFVLDDVQVFENLNAAVNAIPSGGSGVITVEGGTYTDSANFNVDISNKKVTIMPKDSSNPVIFLASGSQQSLLTVSDANAQLTMEHITITGNFSSALGFYRTNQVCTISNCEFKNIQYKNPIRTIEANLVLDGNTFESNGKISLIRSVVKIDDCTFTENYYNYEGEGGAIYAGYLSDVTVTKSKFIMNGAYDKGGAIYARGKLKVDNTEFIGNGAGLGGAIYITGESSDLVNITNCVFDSNVDLNGYRNIYSESTTRKFNLKFNEYDLHLKIDAKDGSYGMDYILDGDFDWGCNLDNNYTLLAGIRDDENLFGDLLNIKNNRFKISMGVLSGRTHEFFMEGMYTQGDSNDHFYNQYYYSDLYGNEFYVIKDGYAKILIDKAKITLTLDVKDVLIPETPVLNVEANWDLNYTIFIGTKYYQLEVVNGKASMPLTGLDLGNYTVIGMRDGDKNYNLVMNFTTFTIAKTYSNFLVLSTNVEYDTLAEAVANSNNEDTIYVKNGTYTDTGIIISDKVLDIIALNGAIFDAQGRDANFITVNKNAVVDISGITFRGLHNRNTNYGAIVNHGGLTLNSCNFTDNKITKTSFAENGGAAIFNDGYSLDIDNCNFINNAAPLKVSTAAVTSVGYEDISITSSKFINNSAREGGALHFKNISQFEAAITSCSFEQNTAVKGSAIYVGNNSRYVAVSQSSFKKNDIKNNLGENTQLEGGVIYVNANTSEVILNIELSNFEDNSNRNVDGGVICLDGISQANIESCIFNNNSGKVGSAILIKNHYNKKFTLIIDGSNFINNHATTGAIATSPKITTLIDECVFTNNTGENRHIYSNGFTVVHDSVFDVKDAKLNALSVQYGENSIISGTADIGTNLYAAANLTVADENVIVEINNNSFSYKTGILSHGKYYAVLNNIADINNNTYVMDSINTIFRVNNVALDFSVSVDNITYGETLKVIERLPQNATGTLMYQLNGKYYTKEEIEALKVDAGKYTLVAVYDHEDFAFSSSTVDFEVYKANPTISVADVEVEYGNTIIVNIETNVPSIYIIEIEDYKIAAFVNGSRSVEINKTFEPGNYTIKVTSQERVNYISNFTEAILKVNKNRALFMLSVSNNVADSDDTIIKVSAPDNAVGNIKYTVSDSNKNIVYTTTQSCSDDLIIPDLDDGTYEINGVFEGDNLYYPTNNIPMTSLSIRKSSVDVNNNNLGEEDDEGRFMYQYDEDDDYRYFDTLEDAVDEAVLYGAGIITVRGGTYSVSSMDIEGEVELTIRAYGDEEVIFDCGGDNYFMLLTYNTEIEWVQVPPPPHPETEQTDGPTVTLENITVINGYARYGGAIDLEAGTLTLMNCNFRNNKAYDEGGAIYIGKWDAENDATLIAVNTTFTNNYAEREGGAIYIASDNLDGQSTSASFMLCTFLDNYQGEDDERVRNYFAGGNVEEITTQYCIFNGNGTIYNFEIDKINQTVYVNGTSTDVFDSVVLLYFGQTPLYTIYNNGSRDFSVTFEDVMGGNYTLGVMNDHKFNTYIFDVTFEMKVPNFIISEDEVYENLTDAIDAVAENGIIYANVNYYDEDNMEIDIAKSFTLKNFRNRDVVFDGSSEKWFFTIAEGYTVVFDGLQFTNGGMKNYASIENNGNLIIKNCSFDSFETGEIIHNTGSLNILNTTFSLNSVNNALVWNDRNLYIETVEFSNNIINKSSAVYNNGVAEIVSSNFTANSNSGNGGAIYNNNSLSVKDTVFTENEGMDGGAIYSMGILQLLNSTFEDNSANGYGGAIFNGNEANIFNSTFTGGFSEKDGGAIYNNHTMTVDNSTFVGNTATGKGGAIYNNGFLVLTKSFFGINYADEFANIYNAGDIQFSENTFDFYDVILDIPDGQYGIPTTITGTLNPEFNMDVQVTLPGFVNNDNATVIISDGIFEYVTDILPKGIYPVKLDEVIYDIYGNIYYGELITDRLIINKANVYINLTVDDVVLPGTPVLKINTSKNGTFQLIFNNKLSTFNITCSTAILTLDAVGEGNYSVFVVREGDENYKDAVNATTFKVSEYEGNFIVNSTGNQFDTLREALADSSNDDIIYVREGNYSGADNLGLTISNKKLSIISLGDVVFDGNSSRLGFLTVESGSDVTLCDVVIRGFNENTPVSVIKNRGNVTLDGCTFVNNTLESKDNALIDSGGNLTIVGSGFYDNILYQSNIILSYAFNLIVNESTFENNTIYYADLIVISSANSAKIISNAFGENRVSTFPYSLIEVYRSTDVLISSAFYNNTLKAEIIYATRNTNLIVNNSIFTGNNVTKPVSSKSNGQIIISECTFTENTVENVVLSDNDKNLSVLESVFSDNTLSGYGALNIASDVNATVNGSVFTNNKADKYRNIYSVCDVNISNSVFDAVNVDFTVHDIDYGQNETINGTIDIGTNLNFTVNLDINSKSYSVNVTDNKFTLNAGILNGGDYTAALNAKDNNSNTYVFNKITKIFTVNRIDPGLSVSIENITEGEKLNVTSTIDKKAKGNVVYELNGVVYSKAQLENLTLNHGNYLVTAMYRGDKNFLSAIVMTNVEVNKVAPNITVNDVAVNYGDEIKINVSVDVADYYTVFLDNRYDESVSLYVEDSAIFTFPSESFKPDSYEIIVYVFETDDYAEAYANATLTVNNAIGVFNLTNDVIIYGENATISVEVPVNAYGNIAYEVYDEDKNLVYSITQSCLEELVVPNLGAGKYIVTGTYEGDSYYSNDSIINSSEIFVNTKGVDLNITVSNITYGENATVYIESNVDGGYIVYVGNEQMIVNVINGAGNVSVPNLSAKIYVANVTIIDSNYSAFNETVFEVSPKSVSVVVSVEDIVYGEDAIVIVYGEIDGEYIAEIYNQTYTVNVADGKGNTSISGLFVDEDILVSVSIADGNYSASNTTTFNITPKEIPVIISVGNITYGEDTVVIVQSDVAGDYIVTIRDANYTVFVNGGTGVKFIPDLGVGNQIVVTVKRDDNYTAFNETTFNINSKMTNVSVSVDDITYGEGAIVNIVAEIDGMYTLSVNGTEYPIEVIDGSASQVISGLAAGNYAVKIAIVDGNYSAFNQTVFYVVPRPISLVVSVEDIIYGENAIVIVEADVDGEYLVYVDENQFMVTVVDGAGNVSVSDLTVGSYAVNVTVVDGNYSAVNFTSFDVAVKEIDVSVSVENITYGESAWVIVLSEIDGEYLVEIYGQNYTVNVVGGKGNTTISDLVVNENILASVFIVDSNYSAYNTTTFNVVPKQIPVIISVVNIIYGEDAVVVVQSDVDGEYIVTIRDENYTVFVNGGDGVKFIPNLGVGNQIVVTVKRDDNYTAFNETTFNINPKPTNVLVSVDDITYGENDSVNIVAEIDGMYTLSVNGTEYLIEVIDGKASQVISGLTVGNYVVQIAIVDGNYSAFNQTTFDVVPRPVSLVVSAENITYGEKAMVIVEADVDGEYLVYVGEEQFTVTVIDGTGNVSVSDLTVGSYAVNVTVVDGNYSGFDSTSFEVNPKPKENATISIDAPEVTEGEKATVTVTLPTDATGTVTIGNKIISIKNGVASAVLTNLPVGNTTVPITYSGDDKYNPIETSVVVTVNEKPVPPKENLTISAVANPITIGEDAVIVVSGLKDATGDVIVTVNGKTYVASIMKGTATVKVSGLTKNVTAAVSYEGDNKYNGASTSVDIVVNPKPKENATISIDAPEVTEGENVTIAVTLPADATGTVTATVGGKTYTVPVQNGAATIIIPDLAKGNYAIPVTYSGDGKYNSVTEDVNINVKENTSDKITAPDVTKYYKGPEKFVVTVTDYRGNPLANKKVKIHINGVDYTRTTDEKGIASMALGLSSNTYDVTVTVDNQTVNSVVTILPTVNGTDLVKVYRNASQYYATFRDSQGNYLAQGSEVTFNINGVMYTRKVSENGLAKLNINLEQGKYIITAINLVTGEMSSNKITVIPRIIENSDLTKYYRNASQYTVKLIGDDGNPVGEGEVVTFNINGVFYSRTTNSSGIAKLNINLNPGSYIITAEYKGCKVSNIIKVLPTLIGKDLTKKYGQAGAFEATLVNGQGKPYANQQISFNINGVFYTRTTNAGGIAKLNINLQPGVYIITSTYGQATASNKVTVTA